MTGRSVTPEHTMALELWLCTKLLSEHGVFSPEYTMVHSSALVIVPNLHTVAKVLCCFYFTTTNDVCTLPVYETCIELWLSSVAWLVLVLFLTKPIVMLVQHP